MDHSDQPRSSPHRVRFAPDDTGHAIKPACKKQLETALHDPAVYDKGVEFPLLNNFSDYRRVATTKPVYGRLSCDIFKNFISIPVQQRDVPFELNPEPVALSFLIRYHAEKDGEVDIRVFRKDTEPGDLILDRVGRQNAQTDANGNNLHRPY